MSVESLEVSLDTLRHWLTFWTLAVAVGLVLEYRKQLWQIAILLAKVVRLRSTAFERCALNKLCIHSLGGILVTVGVAGELWIEFRSSRVENSLRIASGKVISDLNKEAGLARKEAETAKRDAGSFSVRISEANTQAESAKKDAAEANALSKKYEKEIVKANEGAAIARKESAQANERAVNADLARLQLEKQMADRPFEAKEQKALADKIKAFPGLRMDIFEVGNTPESARLARKMAVAFGPWQPRVWYVMGNGIISAGVVLTTGVGFSKMIEDAVNAALVGLGEIHMAAGRLEEQFSGTDVPFAMTGKGNWDPNNVAPIRLFVGLKP